MYLIIHDKVKLESVTYISFNTTMKPVISTTLHSRNTFASTIDLVFPSSREWNTLAETAVAQPTADKFVELEGETVQHLRNVICIVSIIVLFFCICKIYGRRWWKLLSA